MSDRRYLSDDADIDGHEYELVIHDGRAGNGDWYISVLPKGHKIGPTVRVRTSGGEAARLPGFVAAINQAYEALDRTAAARQRLYDPCPDRPDVERADCMLCTGESCEKCGASHGVEGPHCDHDVMERHESPRAR